MMKTFMTSLLLLLMSSPFAGAQTAPPDCSQLDGRPYDPKTDPNIDMFISNWREGTPYQTYGALLERDILTKLQGDPVRPSARGAVLQSLNRLTYAMLQERTSTRPSTLKGEQAVFYIDSGHGTIKAGGKSFPLHKGVGVLVPAGLEFTISNPGDSLLTLYVMTEPVGEDFKSARELIVKDENTIPVGTTKSHWSHILRVMFYRDDPLARMYGLCPVWFAPMTMGQPHSHNLHGEEIWFVVEGEITVLLGKQLRKLTPGMAYKIPPNGTTPHSNINTGDTMVKMFWIGAGEKK